jgi:hypothetical protein
MNALLLEAVLDDNNAHAAEPPAEQLTAAPLKRAA